MFGMGTEKRRDPAAHKAKEVGCDPGKYNPSTNLVKSQSPNFGFGSQKRDAEANKDSKHVPGPGNY